MAPRKNKNKKNNKKKNKIVKFRKSLPLGGFPDRKAVRLRYVDFIGLDSTALGSATPTVHHFRANSLYDPDLSSSGHQPRGFDEHALLYDHYTVIGSKIKVTFESDVDNTSNAGQYCFLVLQDTNATPGSLIDIMEGGQGKTKIGYRPFNNDTGKSVVLNSKYSPKKMFGLPKSASVLTMDELTPQCGANPLEDAIYTIGIICERTTSTNPARIVARVEIEYIAIFSEKKPQVQS